MPPNSPNSPARITASQRRKDAVELRKAGATFQQIGDQLGITKQAAFKTVTIALKAINDEIREQADVIRSLEIERLDKLWFVMYKQAVQGNQGAVDRCLKISERRAKLLGMDAPAESRDEVKIIVERVDYANQND
jgi:hypothetical protein